MPLRQGDKYYYPVTTHDQIILANGERWNGEISTTVSSINGKFGEIILRAVDVGARAIDWVPQIRDIPNLTEELAERVKTVNSVPVDENGNVSLDGTDAAFNDVTANVVTANKIIGAVYM